MGKVPLPKATRKLKSYQASRLMSWRRANAVKATLPKAVRAVRDGRAGPKRCGNHHCFGQLGIGGAAFARFLRMDLDAVRALGCQGNGDGNELLVLGRDCARGSSRLVEGPEGLHRLGGQLANRLQSRQ